MKKKTVDIVFPGFINAPNGAARFVKTLKNNGATFKEKGIDWDNLPLECQRGSCCVKNVITVKKEQIVFPSGKKMVVPTVRLRDTSKLERAWVIDKEIPIFKGEGRKYIEDLIFIEEE